MLPRLNKTLGVFKSSSYANSMHQFWKKDSTSVHPDWDRLFSSNQNVVELKNQKIDQRTKELCISTFFLIRYYRNRGHQLATLDPLNLKNYQEFGKIYVKNPLELDLKMNKVLNDSDLDIPFEFPKQKIFHEQISGFLKQKSEWTLRQVHNKLKQIYCGSIGLQSMHLAKYDEKKWLMAQFQNLTKLKKTKQQKIKILKQLINVQAFNSFLNQKLKTSKRFGVQGLCSMVVGLNQLVQNATDHGIKYIGFGMAHRGRLNALANVFDKPMQKIFAEFQQNTDDDQAQEWGTSGDVKYHLGVTVQKKIKNKQIRLSILPNPSHLQTVNPVCMGHVKAVQDYFQADKKTMSVLIHGDAALAGQGVVYQCLQMAYLKHYHNNGVIHIVANNQIGFTTTPAQARTGLYCTDVAKAIQAPIIHVNADQPELVNQAMRMAIQYRQKFNKDIFIDIIGYRRYGHNQQDQPAFTQPMMYQQIGKRPNIYNIYKDKLISQKLITQNEVKQLWNQKFSKINQAYQESQKQTFQFKKWRVPTYHRVVDYSQLGQINNTGVDRQILKEIGKQITKIPQTFNPHLSIKKIYNSRAQAIQTGEGIDFALGQALAFATLLREGFNVRLSGQDVERGTFSHRHAVIVDQKNQDKYCAISNLLSEKQKIRFQVQNSFLSEYAALGFQYGYSMTNPNTLTIWEAQFGDFANGAQIIIDNYLASGQSKWSVQNGLIMNLPHGMDGQGPQHSSARVQRYLQLVNQSWVNIAQERAKGDNYRPLRNSNLHVICCSNAANLFHAYRRQLRRDYRKPMINLVNKKLLKSKQSSSKLSEFQAHHFEAIIGEVDPAIKPLGVKKVVFCCGQAYYSALQKRKQLQRNDVALIRMQQLAPFYYAGFKDIVRKFKNATEHVWFQEQHRNSGAWNFLAPRFSYILTQMKNEGLIKSSEISCVSRRNSASPAVGQKRKHEEEQRDILFKLFA